MSLLLTLDDFEKVTLPLSHPLCPFPSLSLCLSDKLFGKRLLQAGRHIMSHKSWMKTVPTENCDVLMTFAGQALGDIHKCFYLNSMSLKTLNGASVAHNLNHQKDVSVNL